MITLRDRRTSNLFDPWESLGKKKRTLLDRCWASVYRNYVLEHLPAAKLTDRFIDSFGRPSKDLHVVLGALVLQQLHDLTNSATVEAVAFNVAWHYDLDIQQTSDSYVCERTLRTYRRWVIDKGWDEGLFEQLTLSASRAFQAQNSTNRPKYQNVQLGNENLGCFQMTLLPLLNGSFCRSVNPRLTFRTSRWQFP